MPCLKDMKNKFMIYEINVLLAEMGFFSKLKKKKIKFNTKFISNNQQSKIENFDTTDKIVDMQFDISNNIDKLIEKHEKISQNKESDSILKTRSEIPFNEIIEIRTQEIKRPENPHFTTEINTENFYGELNKNKDLFDVEIPNNSISKEENRQYFNSDFNNLTFAENKKSQRIFMDIGRIKFWNKSSNQNQVEPKKVQNQQNDFAKTKIGLEKTKRDIEEQERSLEYAKKLENQMKDELKKKTEQKKKEEKLRKLELKKKIKEDKLRKLQANKVKKQMEREEKRREKGIIKEERLKEKELKRLDLKRLNEEKLKKREIERLEKQKIKELQKLEEEKQKEILLKQKEEELRIKKLEGEKQKEILLKEKQKQEQLRLKQLEEENIEKQKIKELQKLEEEKQKEILLKQKEEELRLKKLEEEKIEKQKEMLLKERQKEEELKAKVLEKEIQGEIKSDEPPEMGKFIQKETVTKNENPYLDADVEKLLPIIDQLLEKLPDDVVDEFAQSDNFALYEKVVNKYKRK